MKLLRRRIDTLIFGLNSGVLFPKKPLIEFYPEVENCSECPGPLLIQKTWEKTIVTLDIGAFRAKETVLECPDDQAVFTSSTLRSLAPKGCTFGFDVIVNKGVSKGVRLALLRLIEARFF